MEKVFISSVMRDFGDEREAVKAAAESLGLRVLMAETAPASPDPSRTALLPLVEHADVVVLVLGPRYGYIAGSGLSPTEEEFNAARAAAKPVLAFVQNGVTREPEQEAFISRVGGSWEQGNFTGFFDTPQQLGFAVVKALDDLRGQNADGVAAPQAPARAAELAAGTQRPGNSFSSDNGVRIAFVPVGDHQLIDVIALEDATLRERFADLARRHRIINQASGLNVGVSSAGLLATATHPVDYYTPSLQLFGNGSVLGDAEASASGSMGGMALSLPKIEQAIGAVSAAAEDAWGLAANGDRVRQVAACVAVPRSEDRSLSLSGEVGGSMRMPRVPNPVIAPQPALLVRRADLTAPDTTRRLAVSLKRAYADLDALCD